MTNRRVFLPALFCTLLAGVCAPAAAQLESSLGGERQSISSTAYYYISKAGEITMQVNLWGNVKNPGRYEVPISTDLVELLSFAGGPGQNADMADVKIVRMVRGGSTTRKVEFRVNLDRMDRLDDKALDLEPGDTVVIEGTALALRDVITVLSTAAVLTAAAASLINASRR